MNNTQIKKLVCGEIVKTYDSALKILNNLIGFPTTSGNEIDAQHYLAELFESWGCSTDLWEPDLDELKIYPGFLSNRKSFSGSPNLVGKLTGSGTGRSLILNSHIDVVPEGEQSWRDNPWLPRTIDNRIYGRGTSDMKGGGAAVYFAASVINKLGIDLAGDILLQSVIEEEAGGAGTLACISRGYSADAAIIPEPSDMKIFPSSMGSMWFRITIKGLSAHGATSYLGVNAVDKSQLIISGLKNLENKRTEKLFHPLYSHMPVPFCINIGHIHGGTWPSSVPDKTIIEGRMGVSPLETVDQAKHDLECCLSKLSRLDPWLIKNPPELEWFGSCWQSGGISPDHDVISSLKTCYSEVRRDIPIVEGAPWATDAASLNRFGNTPAVIFGPGDGKLAHQVNESISIEKMIEVSMITARFIIDWCGVC